MSRPMQYVLGAEKPRIVLLGEAWGASEEELRKPFVGESGKELFLMLGEAMPDIEPDLHAKARDLFKYGLAWHKHGERWYKAAGIAATNVLAMRPPFNKLEELCDKKSAMPKDYPYPPLTKGRYLKPEYFPELARLEAELLEWDANLVICLGNTALWALTKMTSISLLRGTIRNGRLGAWKGKVLPTYHPAGILRQWIWRPITVADLIKANKESLDKEISRPARRVIINPTIDEVEAWTRALLANPPPILASDTETAFGQITDFGFARSSTEAIVIPFMDPRCPGWSYWPEAGLESRAWECVRLLLESDIPKVFQNGLYDYQYIVKMGIKPHRLVHDTMLKHHAQFPEMLKSLGFMGSIYTREPAWKLMRRKRPDTEKRDE